MKKIITSRRFMYVVLVALIAILLLLMISVTRDTWWVYGIEVFIGALLGCCIGMTIDELFPTKPLDDDDEYIDDDEEDEE